MYIILVRSTVHQLISNFRWLIFFNKQTTFAYDLSCLFSLAWMEQFLRKYIHTNNGGGFFLGYKSDCSLVEW